MMQNVNRTSQRVDEVEEGVEEGVQERMEEDVDEGRVMDMSEASMVLTSPPAPARPLGPGSFNSAPVSSAARAAPMPTAPRAPPMPAAARAAPVPAATMEAPVPAAARGAPVPAAARTAQPMVNLGPCTAIPASVYMGIDWGCSKKATKDLLVAVFGREVLATSTLTGGRSNANSSDQVVRPALDQIKLNELLKFIIKKLGLDRDGKPVMTENQLRHICRTKMSDEKKMRKRVSTRMSHAMSPLLLIAPNADTQTAAEEDDEET